MAIRVTEVRLLVQWDDCPCAKQANPREWAWSAITGAPCALLPVPVDTEQHIQGLGQLAEELQHEMGHGPVRVVVERDGCAPMIQRFNEWGANARMFANAMNSHGRRVSVDLGQGEEPMVLREGKVY